MSVKDALKAYLKRDHYTEWIEKRKRKRERPYYISSALYCENWPRNYQKQRAKKQLYDKKESDTNYLKIKGNPTNREGRKDLET